MRKTLYGLLAALVLVASLGSLATAEQPAPATYHGFPVVSVVIGGQDTGLSGIIIDGVTWGPIRAVMEAVGNRVDWDPRARRVAVEKPVVEPVAAKPIGEETVAPIGDGVSIMVTPEEIAAARAVYDAACAAAQGQCAATVAAANAEYASAAGAAHDAFMAANYSGPNDFEVYQQAYLAAEMACREATASAQTALAQALADAAAAYFAATGEQP